MANFTPNQNEYNNMTPFKTWLKYQINTWGLNSFPFVESDFDDLTNYAMMMKLMKHFNVLIENQNMVEEDMTNLYNAFTELQTYLFNEFADYKNEVDGEIEQFETNVTNRVDSLETFMNNYFDNLDVQEEINNKLDDMVEAGTLQEIIADYLNSKALFGYDNVASMKQSTNLINGSYAKTLGYYAKNDGGKALYKVRTKTNDDVIDNASIIQLLDNTLIAELIPNNNINLEVFGAKGNGTDDDTQYFKKLIQYNESKGNKYTISGINNYLITETLNLTTKCNINIIGKVITNQDIVLFNLKGYNINFYVKTLVSTNDGTCIRLESTDTIITHSNNIKVDNVSGFDTGIHLYANGICGIQYNNFNLNFIDCINYGILIEVTNDSQSWANQNNFYNGKINANYCIYFKQQNVSYYSGNLFMNTALENALIDGITLNNCLNNRFIHIRNAEFTQTTGVFLRIDNISLNNNIDFVSPMTLQYISSSERRNTVSGGLWDVELTTICTEFSTFKGKYIFTSANHQLIRYPMYDTNLDLRTSNYQLFHDGFVIEIGGEANATYSIYLPEVLDILHEFYIRIGYTGSSTQYNVYYSDGTLLFDNSVLTPGKVLHVIKTSKDRRWQIVN